MIAVGGDDSTVWIYNGDDQQLIRVYKLTERVRCLSWHPQKNILAIATSGGVELLDAYSGDTRILAGITSGGRAISWNYTGEMLALADDNGEIQLINIEGQVISTIFKHNRNSYFSVDWHPHKNILLTSSDEIILFDTTGKQLALIYHRNEQAGVLSVKWHPSGTFFSSGDYGHKNEGIPTLLQYWKPDGQLIKTIMGHQAEIRCLRWSSDGEKIATASDALRIWSKDGILLYESKSGPVLWGLSWKFDDKQLVTGCFANGTLQLWDPNASLLKSF
jgi:WD40 repeat protein